MILSKKSSCAYILGIGGSSMQAIAIILKGMGYKVFGSDSRYDKYYDLLAKKGIDVDIVPDINKIKKADFVLYSLAVDINSDELKGVVKLGKPMYSRKQFLYELSRNYDNVVAVSGTHGKSTTTFLISSILKNAGKKATYHIGASSKLIEGGGLYEGDNLLVTEACEYKDSFLAISSSVAVINNIESDHPDYFKSFSQLKNSFYMFASNIRDNGLLIVNAPLKQDFCNYLASINRYDIEVISVGEGGDYYYKNAVIKDKLTFDLYHKDDFIDNFTLNLNGYYNIYNSIISIIVAKYYGVKDSIIKDSLANTLGLDRRYEMLGYYLRAKVITDYAHHPSEIKAVIEAAKQKEKGRIIVVFQPHTYSRTTALFDEFVSCFDNCDMVIITKTFRAREKTGTKSSFDLFISLKDRPVDAYYFDNFIQIATFLKGNLRHNDTLLLLGAGNINDIAKLLK